MVPASEIESLILRNGEAGMPGADWISSSALEDAFDLPFVYSPCELGATDVVRKSSSVSEYW